MKELKPSGLFYVPVPEHTRNVRIYNEEDKPYIRWIDDIINIMDLPKGKWELIGSVTAEHIDFDPEPYTNATGFQGREILLQMLKANDVHFVNPCGQEPDFANYGYDDEDIEAFEDHYEAWQQAESKLVEKILILKPL